MKGLIIWRWTTVTSNNLLTRAAVADVLGVTKRTLETWEKMGSWYLILARIVRHFIIWSS